MAEYCRKCGEKEDFLHSCNGFGRGFDSDIFAESRPESSSLYNWVTLAPLAGIGLDFLVPLPSSLIHSLVLSISGSALIAMVWVSINTGRKRSPKYYVKNLKNFAYTPNMMKIFGSGEGKSSVGLWSAMVIVSTAVQVFVWTPGNSLYLENRISNQIKNGSGASLKSNCPNIGVFLYNEKMVCRVETGIFGITVPARTEISPVTGHSKIKISLI